MTTKGVRALALIAKLLVVFGSAGVNAQTFPLTVPGTTNIWYAGSPSSVVPPTSNCTVSGIRGDGTKPPYVNIPAGTASMQFNVVGTGPSGVGATPGTTSDGIGGQVTSINAAAGMSGISVPRMIPLVGVFLDDSDPNGQVPPATLTYGTGAGQTPLDQASYSPLLRQVFFIGDGYTSIYQQPYSGTQQTFVVPAGATRLFVGFPDGAGYTGINRCYLDNSGSATISAVSFVPTVVVPTTQPQPVPVPSVSGWGVPLLTLLLGAGWWVAGSRRKVR